MGIDQQVEPLHYKRTRVVEMLQEYREAQRSKREEEKKKRLARNAGVVQGIRASLDNERFLVWLVQKIEYDFNITSDMVDEKLADRVKDYYGQWAADGTAANPDADVDALIRLYENADDDVVTIAQTEPVFKYLKIPE